MITAGDWTVIRPLGYGTTSTVNLASNKSNGQLFAVKSSHINFSNFLQKEQNILSSLSSPHIITCLGSEISSNSFNLFLEFSDAGSLSDQAGRLDEPKIRFFTRQILLALCYLHSNGVSHCDIKGRNILLFSDGRLKISDFGCARRVGEKESNCVGIGTPAFMSPEIARGENCGFAGDIWGLGCTVLEMFGGGLNFVTDPFSTIFRIGFADEEPVIPTSISDEGKDFLLNCFKRDPKQRWGAEQLLLHPFVAGVEEDLRWVSPKSTLDFGLWDSEKDVVDEEEDDEEWDSAMERIRQLGSPASADWGWSGSWMAVRREEVSSSGCDLMEIDDVNGIDVGKGIELRTFYHCVVAICYFLLGFLVFFLVSSCLLLCFCFWISIYWKQKFRIF